MSGIRLPYPHPGQQAVRRGARRFNWLAAGRRWRKTTMVMSIAVEAALQGATILWGAPIFDQVRVGWEETQRAAQGVARFNETKMTATFPAAGRILYRSLDDPDNARSHTADGVVIDEVADVAPVAWHEVLRPMLMDTTGWLWAFGTPKGRNWFFTEWQRAAARPDSTAWQAPTLGATLTPTGLVRTPHPLENPHIAFVELEQLYETLPTRVFQQEILAIFLDHEGAVFRNIRPNLTAPIDATPDAHRDHRVVMGVDWAQQHDFTALSVVCATCRQELALDRFHQIEWAIQRDRVKAAAEYWGVARILAERNSIGQPNLEALQREGLPVAGFATTASSKPPLIQALALAFEQRSCAWLPDPVGEGELAAYEAHVHTATGHISYSAPDGLHDDTIIARALAWHTARRTAVQYGPGESWV